MINGDKRGRSLFDSLGLTYKEAPAKERGHKERGHTSFGGMSPNFRKGYTPPSEECPLILGKGTHLLRRNVPLLMSACVGVRSFWLSRLKML